MKNKVALVTGVTGQDGSYLANLLVKKGYKVFGTLRRGSTPRFGRLEFLNLLDKVELISLEITEYSHVFNILREIQPNKIFNLAAQSFVQDSFLNPHMTSNINYLGVLNFLEAMRILNLDCFFYQASTSEMYGEVKSDPQNEETPFNPMSPYAVSKCAGHYLVNNYRSAYNMKLSSGILFNHESELRGREFVTRKITHQLAELKLGRQKPISLGNLDSVRDWGYAPDYVEAMYLISTGTPKDYVVATNEITTVRRFFELSAINLGFNPKFEGEGIYEQCIDTNSGKVLCEVSEKFFRPSDVTYLRGDYSLIKSEHGWSPTHSVEDIAEKMCQFDLDCLNGKINTTGI